MKNSFVVYADYLENIMLLSMEQRGMLFTALISYSSGMELPEMDGMTNMAFSFIKSQMDRDREKYEKTVQARREAGRMGGRPPKAEGSSDKAKKANGFSEKQMKTKKPDNVDEDVDVDENDKKINTSCPVTETAPASPVVISFPLNDGSMYDVTENDVAYYQQLYPAIDCMAELRKLTGWCDANPRNRKTRRGAKSFLNKWLARAQDRAPKVQMQKKEDIPDGEYYGVNAWDL